MIRPASSTRGAATRQLLVANVCAIVTTVANHRADISALIATAAALMVWVVGQAMRSAGPSATYSQKISW